MTLWLSQILQGMAMKYAVEHWRRAMPRGMGTLYWQINDCWPVASWASIDYHGRWKALHYMARQFYAPVLVSAVEDAGSGTVELHVTNDLRQPSRGTVAWRLTDVAGKSLARGKQAISIDPLSTRLVERLDFSAHLAKHGPRDLLVWVEYAGKDGNVSTNFATFARPKHLELVEPEIAAGVKKLDDNQFAVTLTAAQPALWAWLELDGADAMFSDNYHAPVPGRGAAGDRDDRQTDEGEAGGQGAAGAQLDRYVQ